MKDIVIANGYAFGMNGCLEESFQTDFKVTCYFNDLFLLQAAYRDISERIPSARFSIFEVPDEDWNARWKASMQPALVASGIWVSPTWLAPRLSETDHWIKIEPKTAFGTGHHATTRLAAQGLAFLRKKNQFNYSLLDIGTGTGVLCFIAKLSGACFTVGIDIDPVCAENLVENRADNPSSTPSGFAIGNLDMFNSGAAFDCIVMNMLQTESQPLLDQIFRLLRSPGYLVWSGILIEEKNGVISDASKKGFSIFKQFTEEEWWCGIFAK